MPHRRIVQKGSFAGNFDELVKHFINGRPVAKSKVAKPATGKRKAKVNVHQALFESATRQSKSSH